VKGAKAVKPVEAKPVEAKPTKLAHDYSHEYKDKDVVIFTTREVIEGKLVGATKYWFKVLEGNEVIYVNKAHVIAVKPIEVRK